MASTKRQTRSSSKAAEALGPAPARTLKDTEFTLGDYARVVPNGRIVDPSTLRPLPEAGRRRRIDQHWLCCFLRGEVELVPADKPVRRKHNSATLVKVESADSEAPAAEPSLSSEDTE